MTRQASQFKDKIAKHAGPGSNALPRKFGLVYLEATSAGPRRNATDVRDHFVKELAKHGVTGVTGMGYSSDLTKSQEQRTNVISKLKDDKVTSVTSSGNRCSRSS